MTFTSYTTATLQPTTWWRSIQNPSLGRMFQSQATLMRHTDWVREGTLNQSATHIPLSLLPDLQVCEGTASHCLAPAPMEPSGRILRKQKVLNCLSLPREKSTAAGKHWRAADNHSRNRKTGGALIYWWCFWGLGGRGGKSDFQV